MHRCLSCNQPCSLFSAFCDTCRVSLLARRDQAIPEEQAEVVKAVEGSDSAGGAWEASEEMADLAAFPQPEAALVGSQTEQAHASPGPEGGNGAWSFETSGIYAMETVDDLADKEQPEGKGGAVQATHVLLVPPRPRRTMPRNVKRALVVFCVVGVLALITDSVLFALSISRHHVAAGVQSSQPGFIAQVGTSPTSGSTVLAPTSTAQVNVAVPFALSSQRLTFSAVEGQSNLAPQTIILSANPQSFSWQIEQSSTLPAWLRIPVAQGNVAASATASFVVNARPAGLTPGVYTENMLVKAFDTQGHALSGSPAAFVVALNVRQPCVLNVSPAKLSFAAVLLSAPSPQTLTLSEATGCTFPVSWQVSTDASWMTFSRSSGTDTASGGSLTVQASSAGKLIGSYPAHIAFQGTDGSGAPLVISPATITATLTVIA